MLCSQEPEMLREEDLNKSNGLASTNGTETTCCSSGTVGIGEIPECQDSCVGSRALSRTGTEDRILEQELRPTRPSTVLSQDAVSFHSSSICFSRTGMLEQDGNARDIVASALSRDLVEQAARDSQLPIISRHSSREGMATVLSLQGDEMPLGEALERRRQEERLGRELAEGFSKVLSEELELTGVGSQPASARHKAASACSLEVLGGGLPSLCPQSPQSQLPASLPPAQPPPPLPAVLPPVLPPPPMPALPDPPAEPAPRLRLETLSEETEVGNSGEEEQDSRSQAPSADWAGCESVASLGTEGGGGHCTLATIDEEVALLSILDRVMMDVGGELPENCAQQLKLMGQGRALVDGLVHWCGQGADGKPGVVGAQDRAAGPWRPASGSSVASLQSSQVMDDRAYCNDFSNQLWQEICARLDGSLLGQPATLGQDCFPPLAQNTGTAA